MKALYEKESKDEPKNEPKEDPKEEPMPDYWDSDEEKWHYPDD